MIKYVIVAIGLVLVLEGIFPFVSPEKYRQFMKKMSEHSSHSLRVMGVVCMVLGLVIIIVMKQLYGM